MKPLEAMQLAAMALRFYASLPAYRFVRGEQHDQSERAALAAAAPTECAHTWVDARNSTVLSGEVCPKCGAVRAGNQATDAAGEG